MCGIYIFDGTVDLQMLLYFQSTRIAAHLNRLRLQGRFYAAGMGTTSGDKRHPLRLSPPVPPLYVHITHFTAFFIIIIIICFYLGSMGAAKGIYC